MFADDPAKNRLGRRISTRTARGTGEEAIAKFYDMATAPSKLTLDFEKTYECGNDGADVGHILIGSGRDRVIAEGVFTYKVNDEGKMIALRAYWELDQAAKSAQRVAG